MHSTRNRVTQSAAQKIGGMLWAFALACLAVGAFMGVCIWGVVKGGCCP